MGRNPCQRYAVRQGTANFPKTKNPIIADKAFKAVVWQGLTSVFTSDMDILGQFLERWYLGIDENE